MNREELLAAFAEPIPVLDHGFVELLDVMGDDMAILQAARTSTRREASSGNPTADRNLLRYLFRHDHATPFESCRVKLRVKLPIFVERQWVRHRASGLNEVSARYTQLPCEFYVPDVTQRPMAQSTTNRQGSEVGTLTDWQVNTFVQRLTHTCTEAYREYEAAVAAGVALEIARAMLPVNFYTLKVWWCDLRMLLHFLALRMDPHAQWEIRQYADAVARLVEPWVPWTWEAFVDYRLEAVTFSRQEMAVLRGVVRGLVFSEQVRAAGARNWPQERVFSERDFWRDLFPADLTQRERKAFLSALGRLEGLDDAG